MKKQEIFKFAKSYFLITLGLAINVFGWVAFLIPAGIVGGGITGLSSIIFYITGFPMGISILVINSVLVILAIKILGAKFGITSIYGIVVVSVLFLIMPKFVQGPIITEKFMSALIGGAIGGIGIAIAFINGGNSGGTDIIALIITKYKNVSPGKIILSIDILIIASSYFISQKIDTVIYGYVVMGVLTYTLDLLLDGAKQSYQLIIFSKRSHQIANQITQTVGRGVTLINGKGWYSKSDVDVLIVIIRKYDKGKAYQVIAQEDKNAFISESKVSAVFGLGFDQIKL